MNPVFVGPPKPRPAPPPPAWIGRNVIAAGLIAARGLDPAATIELVRDDAVVRDALFFLTGASLEIPAQQQRLKRWLRQFRGDDRDLARTIAVALRLPGAALTTVRDYIIEDHAGQPRGSWRHSGDRAVVDWAIGLIGPAIGPRGSVTFAEAGPAATTILDWIKAVEPFRPAARPRAVSWLQDLERRARPPLPPIPLRLGIAVVAAGRDVGAAPMGRSTTLRPPRRRTEQPGRAAPDAAVWAAAAEGRAWR
jgi:hypothetical protein